MKKKLTVLALCSTALLTACGQKQGTPAAVGDVPQVKSPAGWTQVNREGWPEAVPREGLAKGLTLPIERYLVSYADEITFLEGRGNAEIKCMRALGFHDWRTEKLGDNPPSSGSSSNMERRYGLTIRSEAETTGYRDLSESTGSASELAGQETSQAVIALKGKQNDRAVQALEGKSVPEGGCIGESRRQVPSPDITLAEELSGQSFTASQETSEVKAAMAAWSACMKERGYQVATVWDAANLTDSASSSTSDAERKAALAEIDCKQKTDLVAIWFKAERKIQETLIAKHQDALGKARANTVAGLTAARQVTAATR
ncbi:hypothetical protein [Streptomyces sp. NPDC090093]|uniref:hypothetical protein n=1 Tax=Streptomyces sp. NPDC090093 TaxID=3365945 RepID=UPI00380C19E3